MATDRINREILRTASEGPVRIGPGELYEVTENGRQALFVSFVAQRWLQTAPLGALDFDSDEAGAAIDLLIAGWCSTVIHALAPAPLTLPELDRAVEGLNRHAIRSQLDAMRRVGMVDPRPSDGAGALYAVTDWLRAGIAPLLAAARLEHREQREDAAPVADLDVEAAFMLILPLIELPAELSGRCRLAVEMPGREPHLAGVTAEVEVGRVVACEMRLDERAETWAISPAEDWMDTLIEPDAKRVRTGGDRRLARVLLDGLHERLFGIPVL